MNWLGRFFHRSKQDAQLDSELRFHIEQQTADNIAAGMDPDEARRRALAQFGGLESRKEECREARGTQFIESLLQDIRFGLRMLRKSPGFTAVAVLTLALGIGANTAVFSFTEAVLLRPLPYRDPGNLVFLWASDTQRVRRGISLPDLSDLRAQNRVFDSLSDFIGDASQPFSFGEQSQESVRGLYVGDAFFSVLGVTPYLGREFRPEDAAPGSACSAILSHSFWQSQFGRVRSILDRRIFLNGKPCAVIGVMPHGFFFPDETTQIWLPAPTNFIPGNRGSPAVQVIARLKPGVILTQARIEVDTIAQRLSSSYPDTDKQLKIGLFSLREIMLGNYRAAFWFLLGATALLLLIACANIAHLLLVRGIRRSQEFSIRITFGASRVAITRQLLVESLALGLASGLCGVLFAVLALRLLMRFGLSDIPRFSEAHINLTAFVFAMTVSIAAVVVFGLAPAIRTSRTNLMDSLKQGGPTYSYGARSHVRDLLMVSEVGLAFVLLCGAGLLMNSFVRLSRLDWGFQPDHVIYVDAKIPSTLRKNALLAKNFTERVFTRLRYLPGVESVGMGVGIPVKWTQWHDETLSTGTKPNMEGRQWLVGPGYFKTLGIPLIGGREFINSDGPDSPRVLIVDRDFAEENWPGKDPVGKLVQMKELTENALQKLRRLPRRRGPDDPRVIMLWRDPDSWTKIPAQIIGEVGNVRMFGLADVEPEPSIYVDYAQLNTSDDIPFEKFLLRTSGDPVSVIATARHAVLSVSKAVTIQESASMDTVLSQATGGRGSNKLLLIVSSAASSFGILLAALGIYGVLAYANTVRTHEMGVRSALGAQRIQLFWMLLSRGLLLTTAGILFGLATALATSKVLANYLFEITPDDPLTYFVAALLFLIVASLACYIPARRAMKVDPMVALRYE